MSIPSHILDQLNSQADLVGIISKHTTLKRSGGTFRGKCPFHKGNSQSFSVNPQKNLYHCFKCSASGNTFTFLKEYENLTFMEAVEELSRQTGIEVPKEDNRNLRYQRRPAPPPRPTSPNQKSTQQSNQTSAVPSAAPNPHNNPTNGNTTQNSTPSLPQEECDNVVSRVPDDGFGNGSASGLNRDVNAIEDYYGYKGYEGYEGYEPSTYPPTDDYSNFAPTDFVPTNFVPTNFVPSDFASSDQAAKDTADFGASNGSPSQIQAQEGNLYDLLISIHEFYQYHLQRNPTALAYFKDRGLSDATIKEFGLGYAPQGWQHLEQAFPQDIEGLKVLGLVRQSEKGRDYDLLRDRVIFPIRDNQGRVIGFAGRALDNEVKPKYINSSDSPVFHKQHVLYGYYESRQQRANDWLVVEGYMDVIALYQAGIYGAVASMGTSINEAQISRLLRLNPTLTLCFDGDDAGQKAAWRTLEVALPVLSDDKELRFLTLPNNHDPDTYIAAHGVEAMREQIKQATPLSQYVFAYLSERHDLTMAEGKAKLMSQVRSLTNNLPKGSSFKYLLNNDIYQKLGGRRQQKNSAHDVLLDFDSDMTITRQLELCLLFAPHVLHDDPIKRLWYESGVTSIRLPASLQQDDVSPAMRQDKYIPPALPTWRSFDSHSLTALTEVITRLLPHLPEDTNAAAHFILANLPAQTQQILAKRWQPFWSNLNERGVINIDDLIDDLLVKLMLQALADQLSENKNNIVIASHINRQRQTFMSWHKQQQAKQSTKLT